MRRRQTRRILEGMLVRLLPIAVSAALAAFTCPVLAQTPAPGASSGRAAPAVKDTSAKKPLRGTRATGDEDETNDLEVQRNKRTVEGASSKSGKPKVSDVSPPRSGDNARSNVARPAAAEGQRSGAATPTITDPRAPVETKGDNSIPVRNPRW